MSATSYECPCCAYSLDGLPAARDCPECGEAYTSATRVRPIEEQLTAVRQAMRIAPAGMCFAVALASVLPGPALGAAAFGMLAATAIVGRILALEIKSRHSRVGRPPCWWPGLHRLDSGVKTLLTVNALFASVTLGSAASLVHWLVLQLLRP